MTDVVIRAAGVPDRDTVLDLLEQASLPTEDLQESTSVQFWVAEAGDRVVGAIGLERHGNDGLLRSLAVAPSHRNHGLGAALVDALERDARSSGVRQLTLLTQTADPFFAKLGYGVVARESVPDPLKASAEFRSLCPTSAVCMTKPLRRARVAPAGPAKRLAPALNAACQCIWLDRAQLRRQLEQSLGEAHVLLDARPGLAAGSVVFVDPQDALAMDRTAALVRRALMSPPYVAHIEAHAPPIARLPRSAGGGMLGLDFHLGGSEPQLIEINTNPGGLLVNLELARALAACCDCMPEPVTRLAAGGVALDELPARVAASYLAEWQRARGDRPLETIALVDDDPPNQYLYPEFLLYQRLFERAGWRALIVDASALHARGDGLIADGQRIDLIYNRTTDFYFAEDRHAALRHAYEADSVVITPHPAAHARWADKRLLSWLRDETLLRAAGLDDEERAHLLQSIPPTEIVATAAANDLWRRRKGLFFKPVDGYGSKAAYRGDKLTRATFDHILAHRYVAQAVAPTSSRRVVVEGQETDLRVDVRNYCSGDETWLRAARLYRGQTTNFRTPGGGFAPVLTLPA